MLVPIGFEDPRKELLLAIGVGAVAHHPLVLAQCFVEEQRIGPVEMGLGASGGWLDERGGACHYGPRRMDDGICQYIAVRRATCYMPQRPSTQSGTAACAKKAAARRRTPRSLDKGEQNANYLPAPKFGALRFQL